MKLKVAQSCLTLCDPMKLYSPWNSPGQNNTGVSRHSLLQGSNPGLPHCRPIHHHLSHREAPIMGFKPHSNNSINHCQEYRAHGLVHTRVSMCTMPAGGQCGCVEGLALALRPAPYDAVLAMSQQVCSYTVDHRWLGIH